ncbi:helix-turn-helix domain-containing protein [Nocardioides sp. URHA0020]|uniref:helix-turn-helix domain-containing protein n=1 Tax=Nocardioides sp. URHA0020 TaxID=1380392 RepID=UPI0009E02D4D|nr:helix-turn-helix domain-containing protein [Nocardioides sp. URHA0020]
MANRPATRLELRPGDQPRLAAMTRSPTVRAGLAQRARILLLAAEGLSNTEIADKVGVSRPTVLVWRQRYVERGIDGLSDRSRPGRQPHASAPDVLHASLAVPPRRLGVTHWSSRVLGDELGIGRGTVVRAWHAYGIQPVRGGYRFAVTPPLTGRVVTVLALRLGMPESFAVLDVREPSRAGDRSDDSAADDALRDLATALRRDVPAAPLDPAGALLGFLDELNRARLQWPTASRLHLVTDGRGPVGLPALREALAVRSRVAVHTARDLARWPDMLAAWLAMAAYGDADPAALVAAVERVRAGLAAGEVFTWLHAARSAPARRARSAPPRPTDK